MRYDPDTGKRHELTQTFDTKKEAKNWGEKEAAQYRDDPNRKPPSEETVGDYLKRWFPQMIAQRALRQSSIARYEVDLSPCPSSDWDMQAQVVNTIGYSKRVYHVVE
ncbi:MAG: hypothetical protein M1499_08875 [Firmicutes bacterium]|nr:hypothetical protein [Bacillota bacterium]